MGKTLRVCLAMGGGVSLGTYSGAGLTEALKLLVIYGKDKDNNPYDRVVVDGMSGASAGAISLGILLRCLIDYKSMIPHTSFSTKEDIINSIAKDYYNNNIDAIPETKTEALCALEVAQKIQHEIWVKRVDVQKLYGKKDDKGYEAPIEEPFGLLERKFLEELTKELILPKEDFDSSNLQILDKDRVLFACSLTNLLPMPVGYDSVGNTAQEKNLLRSTASNNHTEVRVIDFVFNENQNKPTDTRWLKFANATDINATDELHFDINTPKSWATLVASVLACGAFPVAFPPVLLKRYKAEFDSLIEDQKTARTKKNSWPGSLLKISDSIHTYKSEVEPLIKNSFFTTDNDENKIDYNSFNFPYVDGGTFNNEPIKEAFRIASFQDYKRKGTDNEDRLVLFVDPIVRKDEFKPFRISSYTPISTDFDKKETTQKGEFSKLLGIVNPLLGALINQGSIKEEQKIIGVSQSLELRDQLFNYINRVHITYDKKLIKTSFEKIRYFLNGNIISIGTRDVHDYICYAIEKECNLEENNLPEYANDLSFILNPTPNEVHTLYNSKESLLPNTIFFDKIDTLDTTLADVNKALKYKEVITKAVLKVISDLALGTAGKNQKITKRAILPVSITGDKIIDLPGHDVAAFAGFASKKSKEYAFEYARLNTAMTLQLGSNGIQYLDQNIANILIEKSKVRLRNTKFYHPETQYANTLQQKLFIPSINRVLNVLHKKSKIVAKVPLFFLGIIGGAILGIRNIFKGGILKQMQKATFKIASKTNYKSLEPITIRIVSAQPIETYRRNKIEIQNSNNTSFKLKTYKGEGDTLLLFQVYILQVDTDTNNGFHDLCLTVSSRFRLPTLDGQGNPIDPNLDIEKWNEALIRNHPETITSFRIKRRGEAISMDFIKNKAQTLYHSLLYAKFHVNPTLQYNLDTNTWSFIENTESLDDQILR